MRMVRWMCGVKLKGRLPSKELRERLGVDDVALVLQQNRLRWYGLVLRKDDDDWVKKCMEYEVEGPRPRGRPKRTRREVVREDCQARKLNKEDAMDCCKWRKMIKDVRWSGWVWVGECFFWYRPTRVVPDKRPLNGCVCVCVREIWLHGSVIVTSVLWHVVRSGLGQSQPRCSRVYRVLRCSSESRHSSLTHSLTWPRRMAVSCHHHYGFANCLINIRLNKAAKNVVSLF